MNKKQKNLIFIVITFFIVILAVGGFFLKAVIDNRMNEAYDATKIFNEALATLVDGFEKQSNQEYRLYYGGEDGFIDYRIKNNQIISVDSAQNLQKISYLDLYEQISAFIDNSDYFLLSKENNNFLKGDVKNFTELNFFEFSGAIRENQSKEQILYENMKLVTSNQGSALIIYYEDKIFVLASDYFVDFDWSRELQ